MDSITPSDQLVEAGSASPIEAGAQGLMSALQGYLGTALSNQQDVEKQKQIAANQAQIDIAKNQAENPKGIPAYLDPQLAEKALPGYGAKMVQDYNKQNPNYPLTMDQGLDYITKAHDLIEKNSPDTTKEDNHQDQLEKQAMDRMTQVRGDQSLMRTEHQRDSAGMAYDTIAKAQSENRPLTELEQTDLIGQLWQARTGKAPTDSDMKLLNDRTAKRGFNHMVTYLTGDPKLVGASTDETLNNLKQFVTSTGQKADQQWSAYMGPRMVKPTGLKQERWDHIISQQRGIPFADQKTTSDKTYPNKAKKMVVTPESVRAKLGI